MYTRPCTRRHGPISYICDRGESLNILSSSCKMILSKHFSRDRHLSGHEGMCLWIVDVLFARIAGSGNLPPLRCFSSHALGSFSLLASGLFSNIHRYPRKKMILCVYFIDISSPQGCRLSHFDLGKDSVHGDCVHAEKCPPAVISGAPPSRHRQLHVLLL